MRPNCGRPRGTTTDSPAAESLMALRRSHGDRESWVRWMQARVEAGYYDRPEVRAKIVGTLTDCFWIH